MFVCFPVNMLAGRARHIFIINVQSLNNIEHLLCMFLWWVDLVILKPKNIVHLWHSPYFYGLEVCAGIFAVSMRIIIEFNARGGKNGDTVGWRLISARNVSMDGQQSLNMAFLTHTIDVINPFRQHKNRWLFILAEHMMKAPRVDSVGERLQWMNRRQHEVIVYILSFEFFMFLKW